MIRNGIHELLEELQTMTAREWISSAAWAVIIAATPTGFLMAAMILPGVLIR